MPRHWSPAAAARVCAPVAVALTVLAMPVAAQERPAVAATAMEADVSPAPAARPAPQPEAVSPEAAPAGPTREAAAVAARPARASEAASAADARAALAPARTHHGPAVALMLVGATAVVLGLVLGEDARTPLVVGGAVVGLIGLYQYLL